MSLAVKPVVKGTRIAVEFIVELLANGWTIDEVLENHPQLKKGDATPAEARSRGLKRRKGSTLYLDRALRRERVPQGRRDLGGKSWTQLQLLRNHQLKDREAPFGNHVRTPRGSADPVKLAFKHGREQAKAKMVYRPMVKLCLRSADGRRYAFARHARKAQQAEDQPNPYRSTCAKPKTRENGSRSLGKRDKKLGLASHSEQNLRIPKGKGSTV